MTQTELRNTVVEALSDYLGMEVILYQPDARAPDGDYVYYIIVNPYIPYGQGIYRNTPIESSDPKFTHDIQNQRIEQASALYRFVTVSNMADHAQDVSEQIQTFFLHTGELELSLQGVVVVDVANPQDVSLYDVDQTDRMWSIDVTFRYTRIDERIDPNIEYLQLIEYKGE